MTTEEPATTRLHIKAIDPDNPDRRMARGESWSLEGALAAAAEACRTYGTAQASITGIINGQPFKCTYTAESWEVEGE